MSLLFDLLVNFLDTINHILHNDLKEQFIQIDNTVLRLNILKIFYTEKGDFEGPNIIGFNSVTVNQLSVVKIVIL